MTGLSSVLVVISFIRGEAGRSCDNNNNQDHAKDLYVHSGAAVDYKLRSQTSKLPSLRHNANVAAARNANVVLKAQERKENLPTRPALVAG